MIFIGAFGVYPLRPVRLELQLKTGEANGIICYGICQMLKASFSKWLITSATAGFAVPMVILLVHTVVSSSGFLTRHLSGLLYWAMRVLWPSSVGLMATAGSENSLSSFEFISFLILINVFLYAVMGCILWGVARIVLLTRGE